MPRIPFIGVRISWLITDRNSDFAALASASASFNRSNWSLDSRSR